MLNLRRVLPTGGGLRDEDWTRRHRLLTVILAVCAGGLTVFGAWRDEVGDPLILVLLMVTLACVVAGRLLSGRRLPSSFVSLGFTAASADFVMMCHGQTEAHFTFFIAVAALALYRDWAPFGMVLLATVVHHALFGLFDATDTYGHHSAQQHPLYWALLHGVAVLFAALFQVVAWRLTETEEARAQASLDKSQAQLGIAFDETPVPMAMISPDGLLLRTNSAYRSWLRLPDELPAGFRVKDLPISPVGTHPRGVLAELVDAPHATVLTRQYRRHDDGSILWVEVHGTDLRDADGNLEMIFVHCLDVTGSRLHEEELRHQVRHDALTGLLSRPGFEGDLAELLAEQSAPACVLYLDVDRFKSINDGLGHAAGDELLRALAARLAATVPAGSLVARLGGDEFVVALPGPLEAGCQTGRDILAALTEPLPLNGGHLQISVSIGLAAGRAAEQAEDAVLAADTAMYAAKRAGGNRLQVFSDEMRVAVKERIAAEARLRAALAGDREAALPVWFQPIVSTATGRIVGAEALVRMFTPEGTLLGPGHFIPAAEETGLVVPLGEHVLRLAVRHLVAWTNQLPYISVNVSPRQLAEPDFVPMVASVLAEHPGLDPSRVVLEITETALLGSAVDVRDRLEAIKDLGVRVALDDFGTGYSSLTWLQSVPADVVKLDRSFVAGLAADPRKSSIISAVLWLARSLNMTVVAEGVEDPDDWKALQAAECPSCQGYLFGRPLPASEFELMLPFPEAARPRQLAG
ncbi:bifunctional diguanylate cyclase/phosphodiesterase [Paractinoplanes deccanensis]|uniref:Bifunctional diguanylate cyclase/phosphodiesterase n=1 Tax=Paractinoplanes deccanensis TaxID=113561 RepID=A0ABQ3Y3W6_9ACTN|nr:EAL domain-containing protein [Actinoplanes deccanensis]GID74565.1 bifunctional diguanylate cyclase/phosphodiesterase [Actinoplanes deccanensis]